MIRKFKKSFVWGCAAISMLLVSNASADIVVVNDMSAGGNLYLKVAAHGKGKSSSFTDRGQFGSADEVYNIYRCPTIDSGGCTVIASGFVANGTTLTFTGNNVAGTLTVHCTGHSELPGWQLFGVKSTCIKPQSGITVINDMSAGGNLYLKVAEHEKGKSASFTSRRTFASADQTYNIYRCPTTFASGCTVIASGIVPNDTILTFTGNNVHGSLAVHCSGAEEKPKWDLFGVENLCNPAPSRIRVTNHMSAGGNFYIKVAAHKKGKSASFTGMRAFGSSDDIYNIYRCPTLGGEGCTVIISGLIPEHSTITLTGNNVKESLAVHCTGAEKPKWETFGVDDLCTKEGFRVINMNSVDVSGISSEIEVASGAGGYSDSFNGERIFNSNDDWYRIRSCSSIGTACNLRITGKFPVGSILYIYHVQRATKRSIATITISCGGPKAEKIDLNNSGTLYGLERVDLIDRRGRDCITSK